MTRVNINILGISELKWTGMVNLILMTIIPTTVGKIGEGNGTPLQYSCLENPMDGGAW